MRIPFPWSKKTLIKKPKITRHNDTARVKPAEWNEEEYLQVNPDVKAAVEQGAQKSGFDHWQQHGRFEKRRLGPPKLPKWLRDEMFALSNIEPKVFPSDAFCMSLTQAGPMIQSTAGMLYVQLLREIGDGSFTHIFLLPWLKAGGADAEALHHIKTLSNDFGARVLVFLTENADSQWLNRLPDSVTAVQFGLLRAGVTEFEAQLVLARLLLKVKPLAIHNINSAIGWRVFRRYGTALQSQCGLYASVFSFDYTPEGEPIGYARELCNVYPNLSLVFSDNQAFPAKLKSIYGLPDSLFHVMRYPVRVSARFAYLPEARPTILWASRLDREKRPDILKRIATSLPELTFHVFGTGLLDKSRETTNVCESLRQMKNVVMFGEYQGFDSIPLHNYALFLYTSQWDGMPNVVLEALAAGLAVVAPNIGGIDEVIDPESGFLIPQFDNVEAYVETILRVVAAPEIIMAERQKRLALLRELYSPEAFSASLGELQAYHSGLPSRGEPCKPQKRTVDSSSDD